MFSKHILMISVSLIGFSAAAFAQEPPAAIPAPAVPAATPVAAPAAAPAASGPVTRQEIPALVKEAIMNDPDIIMEAVKKLREKQAAEQKQKAAAAITQQRDAVYNDADTPTIGDAKGDVVLVEFFDYHCGYCRNLLPTLTKLAEEDKGLRIVFKELPILSEESVTAARAALAVSRIAKNKYFDYHTALMKHEGKYDEKSLLDIAKKIGISSDKLKAEMGKPEITALLDKNRKLADDVGVRGTPAIIIADQLSPGAPDYEGLKTMIADARKDAASANTAAPAVKPAIGGGKKESPDAAAPAAGAPAQQ